MPLGAIHVVRDQPVEILSQRPAGPFVAVCPARVASWQEQRKNEGMPLKTLIAVVIVIGPCRRR